MSLSSLIVEREIATIREVEEALARQVLYGGDLVTNLLEVAKLDEAALTELLAASYGFAPAPPGVLPPPSEAARAVLPPEMATRQAVVPLAAEGRALVIAVSEPLSPEAEDELSSALAMRIDQRIAPLFRIREALSREYGDPLERRLQRLLTRLSGGRVSFGSLPPLASPSIPPEPPRPSAPPPEERTVTPTRPDAAHGLPGPPAAAASAPPGRYASVRPSSPPEHFRSSSRPPAPLPPTVVPGSPSTPPERTSFVASVPPHGGHGRSASGPAPARVSSVGTASHASSSGAPPAPPRGGESTPNVGTAQATLIHRRAPAPRRAPRRHGPLFLDAARAALDEADDRDAILDLFFDFSRQFFDYTALFVVHGDVAEGRDAFGEGASRDRVVAIEVPLDAPSVLRAARSQGGRVVAAPTTEGLDPIFFNDIERPMGPVVVVPVIVRTRVVALLLGAAGDEDEAAGRVAEAAADVEAFAVNVGQAFGRLIMRRKQRVSQPPAAPMRPPAVSHVAPIAPSDGRMRERAPEPEPSAPRTRDEDDVHPADLEGPTLPDAQTPIARPVYRLDPDATEPEIPMRALRGETLDRIAIPEDDVADVAARSSAPRLEVRPTTEQDERDVLVAVEEAPPSSERDHEASAFDVHGHAVVSVAARRPPSSQRMDVASELPSVIVDVEPEHVALVERYAARRDEEAEAELLRLGPIAMPAIMQRFPGPITVARELLEADRPPRPSDSGPILHLVAAQRRAALPFVIAQLTDPDAEKRFWAAFMLSDLAYGDAARALAPVLFDEDARVRRMALHAARAIVEHAPGVLADRLGRLASDKTGSRARRIAAVDMLKDVRERDAVPLLVRLLSDADDDVVMAARRALAALTHQDFARDTKRWMAWWAANGARHRVEWLIDALGNELAPVRRMAIEELRAVTGESFAYAEDLPKRDRERAQQRFREWWQVVGRARFER